MTRALRGDRVFVDWLRNNPIATAIAPYSLRARPLAPVATPLTWSEVETTDPDAFAIGDVDRILDRPDPLAELASAPSDTGRFVARGVRGVWARFRDLRSLPLLTSTRCTDPRHASRPSGSGKVTVSTVPHARA